MSEQKNSIQRVFNQIAEGSYRINVLPKDPPKAELPAQVYVLNFFESQQEAYFYLSVTNEFKLPERVYGDVSKNIAHFFKSFCLNNKNLGTLLVGERGSGKTITLKAMAQKAIEMGMPVIIINQPYRGDMFVSFLSNIKQECLICFDEFCKTYSELSQHGGQFASKAQDSILQILDGAAVSGKKMFVLTANDINLISPYLQDRPGRIRYMIRFKHMEVQTVIDFVKENLQKYSEEHENAFIHMALSHAGAKVGLNFDGMSSFVTEMNQFDYDLNQCLAIMAVNGTQTNGFFQVQVLASGKEIVKGAGTSTHEGAYLRKDKFVLGVTHVLAGEAEKPSTMASIDLSQEHFIGYHNGDKQVLELMKDGVTYLCRYVDRDLYNESHNNLREEYEAGRSPWRSSGGGFRQQPVY